MSMELFPSFADTDSPRGSVLLAHGFGEHRGRYVAFTDALNEAGYDTWSFDFTGHGSSAGKRARVDVRKLIAEHLTARRDVLALSRTDSLFLFGHSMGGLITLASTLLSPTRVTAVAVTGPALEPLPRVHPLAIRAGVRVGTVLPMIDSVSLDTNLLSRDPEVVAAYEADPDVFHGKVPLITGATMAQQGWEVIQNARILARPVLILHGEDDGLADVKGSLKFAERAGNQVEIVTFPEAFHELLNEPEQQVYREMIIDWFGKW